MVTIAQQIQALDEQIAHLERLAKTEGNDWANSRLIGLVAAKRTLATVKSIGQGMK